MLETVFVVGGFLALAACWIAYRQETHEGAEAVGHETTTRT